MCQLHRKRQRSPSSSAAAAVTSLLSNGAKMRKTSALRAAGADYASPSSTAVAGGVTKQQRLASRCKISPASCEPQDSDFLKDEHSAEHCTNQTEEKEFATSVHRDEIVAAILTIASALGLARETLHLCVDVLDRYMDKRPVEASRLETLSIACLWIAVKFMETPMTILDKSIKKMLQQRRHSGNWTWQEIIEVETEVLKELNFRVMAPTTLGLLQKKIYGLDEPLPTEKMHLAYYFADLFLLKDRSREFAKELLVDAIWYVLSEHQITNVQPPLLAPVVILFLAHRDNINPKHPVFKAWFALRCQYGAFLSTPWRVPYDPYCICRVCENVQDAQDELEELMEASASDPGLLLLSAKRSLNLV